MRSAALVLIALTWAQQAPPPRDAEIKPTIGTSTISGVVVNDDDRPQRVRRAIVTLTGSDLRPSRGAITDDAGRFSIGNLPAGRFTLTVAKASFVTSVYGAKRPGRPGTPIAVAAGASVTDLIVRLWRGAAIAGVLRDDRGVPIRGIAITAIRARAAVNTSVFTLSNNGATTNDLGEFRIFGLEPGKYVVEARTSAGGGGPMTTMSEAEVDRALDAIRRRTTSNAPGTPASASTASATPAPKPFDYAPVFYPGTAVVSQATPITLVAGQEQGGIDFSLQRVATATVEGIVSRSDGQPAAAATVQLTAITPPGTLALETPLQLNATTGPTGAFIIPQVTPGDYQLLARVPVTPPPPAPNTGMVTPGQTGPSLWGQVDISVVGNDIKNLAVAAEPGLTMSGRIRFEGESLKPPADLTRLRVYLAPEAVINQRPGTAIRTITFSPSVPAQADGTFTITGIAPGTYVLQMQGLPADAALWWPRSARLGNRDLFDGLVDLRRGADLGNVAVVYSDRHTELSGSLQTAAGAPASDVFVIAYASDRQSWGPRARRVQAVRPGVDGRFSMKDLPPGDYLLAAMTDIDQDEWQDPAFLERLVPSSIRITIAEGEKKIQDLRIGG
jgi:uncharacterized protein (DUF2141 family)